MKRAIVVVAVILVLGGLVAGGYWLVRRNPQWQAMAKDQLDQALEELGLAPGEAQAGLVASGFIEAEETAVSSDQGGRILALHADEGDEVTAGEVLVELDRSPLQAQMEQAQAQLAVAEARLELVKAGVREETLSHARASLEQAVAAREAARVAWEDAQARVENPQQLEVEITRAQARADELALGVEQALALAQAAQEAHELADALMEIIQDFEPYNLSVDSHTVRVKLPADVKIKAEQEQARATYQAWEAWTGVDQAQSAQQGAERYLAELLQQRANPLALEAEATAAESQFWIATANVGLAEAHVEGLEIGARQEEIAAAEAQVQVARAALQAIQVRLDKLVLEAPISGLVLERPVHVGELARPGAPLLTLADLDEVTLTVYVPEDQIGGVQLRQPVSVTVDAYPDRAFRGQVVFIASEAEFTPKNVQTQEERVSMVFAVKVKVPNSEHLLKPGMPADAVLAEEMEE
jgi:multidrug resistance efflux pump